MLEELMIPLTEIVKARIAVTIANKTILRALSMASKLILALLTLLWKKSILYLGKVLLSVAIHHLIDGMLRQVAKFMFWINKVIT